jgi:uncharacterized delta-60 repeat protein
MMSFRTTVSALVVIGAVATGVAAAAPGDLDSSFGTGAPAGTVVTSIPAFAGANALAVQSDGKLVVAGEVGSTSGPDFAVARYEANGSPDVSFGTGEVPGVAKTPVGPFGTSDAASGLAIQPDGKLVAAGAAGSDFAVVRYDPSGALDSSFGSGGKVTTDFGGAADGAKAVALQADGKIVAAGGNGADFAVARYNADGAPDASFGTAGKVTTDFAGSLDRAWAIVVQADGKLVVGGNAIGPAGQDFALVRYNAGGSLDSSFGIGGKVLTDFAGGTDGIRGLAIQSDGRLVAGGLAFSGASFEHAYARFNTDGSLDTSFAGSGRKLVTGRGGWVLGVAVQPDGKIVGAGFGDGDFDLERLDPNGDAELAAADFGGFGQATAVAIRSNGTAVAAGGSARRIALAAFAPDFAPDPTFGTAGKVTTTIAGEARAVALAIQPDGKLISAGSAVGLDRDLALTRHNPDGSLDTSFGTGGFVTADLGSKTESGATDLVVQPDGKLVVVETATIGVIVARFNADGSPDTSFGTGGNVVTATPFAGVFAGAVVLQSNGKLVVGDTEFGGVNYEFALRRFNADGVLDTSFGVGGKAITAFGRQSSLGDLLVLPGDKLLAAGGRSTGAPFDWGFALVRYNADGSFDTSFGNGGSVETSFSAGTDSATAVLVQPDGKIVAAGASDDAAGTNALDFALARYNIDGSLDGAFGTGGKVVTPFGFQAGINGLVRQPDGKLFAVGGLNTPLAARYNADGSLDASFGSGGTVRYFGLSGRASEVVLQPDGKAVAAGESVFGFDKGFLLLRYLTTPSDTAAPTDTPVVSGTLGNNGWYTSDVSVAWNWTDVDSGVDPANCAQTVASSVEGSAVVVTSSCHDLAGNAASDSRTFQIDKTSPTVAVTNVTDGAQYVLGAVPAAGCSTTDGTSGVAAAASVTVAPTGSNGVGLFTATCAGATDKAGNQASSVSARYVVVYAFGGFFSPVDNPPVVNVVKAGQAIPVKFSLAGNRGLNIFAAGYPTSQQIACNTSAPLDDIEQTVTAGSSSLAYDATSGQYTYVWKTDKAWAQTCRQLNLRMVDGSSHIAYFSLK